MTAQQWADRLVQLGLAVRLAVISARDGGQDLATPVAHEGGDTVFAIDRHVEPVVERVVASWNQRVVLIAEGLGPTGRKEFSPGSGFSEPDNPKPKKGFRLIVDPIDGTRNIMYDKRSAWCIAAITADKGESTTVADAYAAAVVELPTTKAGWADTYSATCDGGVSGWRQRLVESNAAEPDAKGAAATAVILMPSGAPTLENGFAQVSNWGAC